MQEGSQAYKEQSGYDQQSAHRPVPWEESTTLSFMPEYPGQN